MLATALPKWVAIKLTFFAHWNCGQHFTRLKKCTKLHATSLYNRFVWYVSQHAMKMSNCTGTPFLPRISRCSQTTFTLVIVRENLTLTCTPVYEMWNIEYGFLLKRILEKNFLKCILIKFVILQWAQKWSYKGDI